MKKIIGCILIIAVLMSIVPIEGRRAYSNEPVLAGNVNQYASANTVVGNAYASNYATVYQSSRGGYARGYIPIPYRYMRPYYGCVVNIVNIYQTTIASSVYGNAIATNTATVRRMPPRRCP